MNPETSKPILRHKALGLGEIRLLRILPVTEDGALRYEMVHCALSESSMADGNGEESRTPLVYAALSYTWVPKTPLHEIKIDGQMFYIRDNLYQSLKRLSIEKLPCEYIWTDAICIIQDDIAEKTAQVRIMGTIFGQAREVLVWLGEDDESSALVMSLALARESRIHTTR